MPLYLAGVVVLSRTRAVGNHVTERSDIRHEHQWTRNQKEQRISRGRSRAGIFQSPLIDSKFPGGFSFVFFRVHLWFNSKETAFLDGGTTSVSSVAAARRNDLPTDGPDGAGPSASVSSRPGQNTFCGRGCAVLPRLLRVRALTRSAATFPLCFN